MVNKRRGPASGKAKFMKKKRNMRREAKIATVKDDAQDYRLNTVEKQVKQLTKGTKGYAVASFSKQVIKTVNGQTATGSMSVYEQDIVSDVNGANAVTGLVDDIFFTIKHIGLKYQIGTDISNTIVNTDGAIRCRVFLICYHQPAGSANSSGLSARPNYNELFAVQSGGLDGSNVLDHWSRLNRQNFTVLYDKHHVLSPPAYADATDASGYDNINTGVISVDIDPPSRAETVSLNDDTAPISTAFNFTAQNQYFLFALCDTNSDVGGPTLTYNYVVDYVS